MRERKYGDCQLYRKLGMVMFVGLVVTMLTACGKNTHSQTTITPKQEKYDTGYVVTGPDSFDSADTTVITKINKKDNTVTFMNLNREKYYTLNVDGTTHLLDKYGESISLEQFAVGDVVDVQFLKKEKHLTNMKLSAEAWKNEGVSRYEIDDLRGEVSIGEDIFQLTNCTQYLSMGKQIEKMDLNASDVLDFQGIGNQILSINVSKGHGYLRLENDENFVGGWIEIGQTMVKAITEDMLLTVPEGSYQVTISHRGGGGVKNVTIHRNEETTLDIGDLEVVAPQTGILLFSVSPAKATVYIDGEKKDVSEPVELEYGIHQLIVKAEEYKAITQYIRVGQPSVGINIVLERLDKDDKDDDENVTDASSNYYKVYIDAPEDAEVYLDGNYIGIVPCSFKKQAGAHVITLRKSKYTTRSYTIQVDQEEKDLTFSFAELVPVDDSVSGGDE